MTRYRALTGLDYPTPAGMRRVEIGTVVDDLPPEAVGWLLEGNSIEVAPDAPHHKEKPPKPTDEEVDA